MHAVLQRFRLRNLNGRKVMPGRQVRVGFGNAESILVIHWLASGRGPKFGKRVRVAAVQTCAQDAQEPRAIVSVQSSRRPPLYLDRNRRNPVNSDSAD